MSDARPYDPPCLIELSHCPHCGPPDHPIHAAAQAPQMKSIDDQFYVSCPLCRCRGGWSTTPTGAAKWWNTRWSP
jgi:hypothetical protein